MKQLVLALILFPVASAMAGEIVFEQIGFQTPSGLVLVHKDGTVKWGKTTPPADYRLFWDAMVTEKAGATVDLDKASKAQAVADYNDAVLSMAVQGRPDGNEAAQAKKLWKALKTLFPAVFK